MWHMWQKKALHILSIWHDVSLNYSATVSERKTKPNFFEKSPKIGGFPER